MSYGVGRRGSSDLALLWLWHRSAAAAPTGPLAWELPYAVGAALKIQKKKIMHVKSLGASTGGKLWLVIIIIVGTQNT